MTPSTPSYDGTLQMFRELPRAVDMAHLRFLRWLVEAGRLEHPPYGPPSGELTEPPLAQDRFGEPR
jgi:hypothetical protein